MEISLQIGCTSTKYGEMVRFKHKGRYKQKAKTIAMQNGKRGNFYEVLSLDSSKFVGLEEIKKAYRCKALNYHPDVCSSSAKEESTRRFLEINLAYETLSDPISRQMYDHELGLFNEEVGRRGHKISFCLVNRSWLERFPRAVWERQLNGLKKQSSRKMGKRLD